MSVKGRSYPVHLVRDVAQHNSGADITAIKDALPADTIVLISWVTLVLAVEGTSGRTVTDEATLIINARLRAVRRVQGALASPSDRLNNSPPKGLLRRC